MWRSPAPVLAQAIPADRDSALCAVARQYLERQTDSLMALAPQDWVPDSSEKELVAAMREADVVAQFVIDTLGKIDLKTARIVRWRSAALVGPALRSLRQIEPEAYEVLPGCPARHLRTLPILWSRRQSPRPQ